MGAPFTPCWPAVPGELQEGNVSHVLRNVRQRFVERGCRQSRLKLATAPLTKPDSGRDYCPELPILAPKALKNL